MTIVVAWPIHRMSQVLAFQVASVGRLTLQGFSNQPSFRSITVINNVFLQFHVLAFGFCLAVASPACHKISQITSFSIGLHAPHSGPSQSPALHPSWTYETAWSTDETWDSTVSARSTHYRWLGRICGPIKRRGLNNSVGEKVLPSWQALTASNYGSLQHVGPCTGASWALTQGLFTGEGLPSGFSFRQRPPWQIETFSWNGPS
jgi:hypothetical protein